MKEEVKRILKLVQEGKLSADDAAELIEAFEEGEHKVEEPATAGAATSSNGSSGSQSSSSQSSSDRKDPFKDFIEQIERLGHEAAGSVNWQEVARQAREGAKKGAEALRTGIEEISKGRFVGFSTGTAHEENLNFSITDGKLLKVHNSSGEVKITGGAEGGSVRSRAYVRGLMAVPKEDAEKYSLIIEESEHVVSIRLPDVTGLSADLDIKVPTGTPVEVKSLSGTITLVGTDAGARINGKSGAISAKGLKGPVEISLTSGAVTVEDCNGPSLSVENKSGSIRLSKIDASTNLRTASGSIKIEQFEGRTLSAEAVAGDILADIVNPVTGTVNLQTVSGEINVDVADGSDCRVSLGSVRGEVSTQLTLSEEMKSDRRIDGRLGSGSGSLTASAVSGNVRLRLRDHSRD
ncbi:MAG: DUF4097 family beta strand repeat protein [Armatimonadetes bacterium]|nr:DUF4097 family beta strand repeat protein [Armatimonadota bacterium]